MFKGRARQIEDALDAIFQRSQHIVILGERGVGKSSMANILYDLIAGLGAKAPNYWYGRVNCGRRETFTTLWKEAFRSVKFTQSKPAMGFGSESSPKDEKTLTLTDLINEEELSPARIVTIIRNNPGIWVFDEYNTLQRRDAQPFADLLKALSDAGTQAKLVLVGVADSIGNLIEDHASVERSVRQILMPRMDADEMTAIIQGAESETGLSYSDDAKKAILALSQGLPYFTHQIGLFSAKAALGRLCTDVEFQDVLNGIAEALRASEESIKEAYRLATHSQKKGALYRHVLLACAIAQKNEFGFFRQGDVGGPLSMIRNRRQVPGVFAAHLSAFCDQARGPVLSRRGPAHNYVYRFLNPLLQPYAIMQGMSEGLLSHDWLTHFASSDTDTEPLPTGDAANSRA